MNWRAALIFSFFLCPSIRAALPPHSTSPSRQFIIYGATDSLRGEISQIAEQTKSNLLSVLQASDGWKTPIVINLQTAQANTPELPPANLRFSQTGFGFKLQLDLTIARIIDAPFVERELLRAILLEMIYRHQPDIAPGTVYVGPPDWLVEGMLASAPGRDWQSFTDALAATDTIIPLEEFLQRRPALLDHSGRSLYRAYSLALVQLLVRETDGAARLARYIDNLSHSSNDALAELTKVFPELRGAT